jgi:hypothetical protein
VDDPGEQFKPSTVLGALTLWTLYGTALAWLGVCRLLLKLDQKLKRRK